ncbi:MAG: hypothetical protein RL268_182 [Pseudomonadota bacterium]|jgi:hypothetical protein
MPHKRIYRDMSKRITADEARRKYMNPRMIDRVNERMSRDDISAAIINHAAELRWLLDNYYEPLARGQHAGRVTKKRLVQMANQLHDWWNIADMRKSAGAGVPIIWEE